tara:strand:- start:35 stop:283 length:249 start_codon:yes stop_codon:yes gene_type:complete
MEIIEISGEKLDAPKILIEENTINGTETMLIRLTMAVNEMDKATSPFANFVNTFVVTPPGAAEIIIKPTAISNGGLIIKIKI